MANYYPHQRSRISASRQAAIQAAGRELLENMLHTAAREARSGALDDAISQTQSMKPGQYYYERELRQRWEDAGREFGELMGVPARLAPITSVIIPWIAPASMAWLAGQMYDHLHHPVMPDDKPAKPGTGAGYEVPPGWSVRYKCGSTPAEYLYGTDRLQNSCAGRLYPTPPTPDWQAAVAAKGANYGTTPVQVEPSKLWLVNPAEVWVQNDPNAVTPPGWNPGEDAEPGQKPVPLPPPLPLGDPGLQPGHMPSMFPGTAFAGQTTLPVPFNALKTFNAWSNGMDPLIMREVGPGPERVPSRDSSAYERQLEYAESRLDAGQSSPASDNPQYQRFLPEEPSEGIFPPLDAWRQYEVSPEGMTPQPPKGLYEKPGPGKREKKMYVTPKVLLGIFTLSTYGGALVRALHKSLPYECKSKAKGGKRRYDSMLADVYKCLDHVHWDVFARLAAQTWLKFALEGWIGKTIDVQTRTIRGAGPHYGLSTDIMHALGPSMEPVSEHGGAFTGRNDPFAWLNAGLKAINEPLYHDDQRAPRRVSRRGIYE